MSDNRLHVHIYELWSSVQFIFPREIGLLIYIVHVGRHITNTSGILILIF